MSSGGFLYPTLKVCRSSQISQVVWRFSECEQCLLSPSFLGSRLSSNPTLRLSALSAESTFSKDNTGPPRPHPGADRGPGGALRGPSKAEADGGRQRQTEALRGPQRGPEARGGRPTRIRTWRRERASARG
ncbi:unnamed protein product [Arctogadus glacialis]